MTERGHRGIEAASVNGQQCCRCPTISAATRDTLVMYGIALDTPALNRWLEVIEDAVLAERERCLKIIAPYGGADFRELEEAIRAG